MCQNTPARGATTYRHCPGNPWKRPTWAHFLSRFFLQHFLGKPLLLGSLERTIPSLELFSKEIPGQGWQQPSIHRPLFISAGPRCRRRSDSECKESEPCAMFHLNFKFPSKTTFTHIHVCLDIVVVEAREWKKKHIFTRKGRNNNSSFSPCTRGLGFCKATHTDTHYH